MSLTGITLLWVPGSRPTKPLDETPERYDRFAAELEGALGVPVKRQIGMLSQVPADGTVLVRLTTSWSTAVTDFEPEAARRLAARTILLGVSAHGLLDLLERHRFAGAVDGLTFAEWSAGSTAGTGPFGRRVIAETIGAECAPGYRSAHYCRMDREQGAGLVSLLADYLRACVS